MASNTRYIDGPDPISPRCGYGCGLCWTRVADGEAEADAQRRAALQLLASAANTSWGYGYTGHQGSIAGEAPALAAPVAAAVDAYNATQAAQASALLATMKARAAAQPAPIPVPRAPEPRVDMLAMLPPEDEEDELPGMLGAMLSGSA